MILYHAISTYQLLEMILYRLKNSTRDESILMITDSLYDKFPINDTFYELFKEIWVYEINIPFPKGQTFVKVIDKYFNEYFAQKDFKLQDFDEMNVACCHYYFGHYLVNNNIPFVFFEDAAGIISRPDILINIEKDKRPFKCQKNQELGLYDGTNEIIKKVVCNKTAQTEHALSKYLNIEDFNVVKELESCDSEIKNTIINMFISKQKFEIPHDVSVLLTQHFANLKILSYDEQQLIYKLFIDYFFEGKKVIIKPHPDDVLNYSNFNVEIIRDKFPSEFLSVITDNSIQEIATISSTAIKNFYDCNVNVFELGTDFEKTFYSIHKYYIALCLIKELGLNSYSNLNCDEWMIEALSNRNHSLIHLYADKNASVCLVDDYIDLENSVNNCKNFEDLLEKVNKLKEEHELLIFLNSKEVYSFYNGDLGVFDNIYPLKISIESAPKKWWDIENEEKQKKEDVIYVYSKNQEYMNKIKEFKMEKELVYTESVVKVDELSNYERKIYEGKIRALEERLKYYVNIVENSSDNQ